MSRFHFARLNQVLGFADPEFMATVSRKIDHSFHRTHRFNKRQIFFLVCILLKYVTVQDLCIDPLLQFYAELSILTGSRLVVTRLPCRYNPQNCYKNFLQSQRPLPAHSAHNSYDSRVARR